MRVATTDGTVHEHPHDSRHRTHDGVLTITEYPNAYNPRYVHYSLVNVIKWWEAD